MSYRVQSIDTSIEAEQFQIGLLQKKGILGRSNLMRSLLRTNLRLAWNSLRALYPHLSYLEAFIFFVELNYGKEIAREVALYLDRLTQQGRLIAEEKLMISDDIIEALNPVVDVMEKLGIPYLIGGSVASSIHGITRSTVDADLVIDLKHEQVAEFIANLENDYYISLIAIEQALARQSSFNLVHLGTSLKLDFFILKSDKFNQTGFNRGTYARLSDTQQRLFRLNSAEDIVLQKLLWYKSAGGISEKQWLDILGVLKLQRIKLDRNYLAEWATQLSIDDLLTKALNEAGFSE